MIRFVDTVNWRGVLPETLLALTIANEIYTAAGLDLWITSVTDGQHAAGPTHILGAAVDIRTHGVPRESLDNLVETIGRRLGPQFDVVLESRDGMNEHLHIEFDPRKKIEL